MPFHRSLRSAVAGICVLLAASLAAGEEKKAPLLTEKEIADGWVLLFDGETTFGWDGKATVKDGVLDIAKGDTLTFGTALPLGEVKAEVEQVEVKYWTSDHVQKMGWLRIDVPGEVSISRIKDGNKLQMKWTLRALGKTHDEDPAFPEAIDSTTTAALVIRAMNQLGHVKSVKYRPAKTEKLFNGKDLTGWKVFKDEKRSKTAFAVTAAGELSAKNGPGDLQSEKQFDDFLLQLECKTNGAALNSGVFFRCIADQYQNGYEMQIQNAYKEGDRTKPADFGTGAIYRRVPARKVVSNDNEWFAMTLLAVGPRFATWVNGYPVVSWKDERAANDNPRQGLKTGKGHLSIQGHDPTTDLLFRNLRAVEVK